MILQQRKEFRKIKTPKSTEFTIANLETKGEAGNLLENRLFGEKVEHVTANAAEILLRHNEEDLAHFKQNFRNNNIFNPESLPMREGREGLEIGYCGPPFSGFDDLELLSNE